MNQRQHLWLLMLMGFTYILLGTLHTVRMNYVSWFCVLYFIASYIRIYPKNWMSSTKKCGVMMILTILVSALSVVIRAKIGVYAYYFVIDSNTLLAVLLGIFSFLFFKNIRIPYNKFINTVAASTFGVLCIHINSDTMKRLIWKDILDNVGHYDAPFMPIYAIICVLGVFTVCTLIDQIRIHCIEKPFFSFWDKNWDNFEMRFKAVINKFLKKMNIE